MSKARQQSKMSSPQGLLGLGASEASAHLKAGDFTATDLIKETLGQIEQLDPQIHAWAYLDRDAAVRQAAVIDRKIRAGESLGKLAGIPVGVKDVFNTADMPTQMGSPIWKGFTPGNDARVVHYLRMADSVIPGKTVTAEFAVHTPGPTLNPHHPDYIPGTSSSGSAAAVAAYMLPLAIGTQTAGSIIRPASYCGVYGFKPSFGLLPRTGMLKTTDTLDTVGVFARTIDDIRLIFDTLRVDGLDYPISHAALNDAQRQERKGVRWRVGVVRGPKWQHAEGYAKEALSAFAEQVGGLSDIDVEEVTLPETFNSTHEVHATIYDRTLAYYFKDEFKRHTLISPLMYEIINRGNDISLDDYKLALTRQAKLASQLDRLLADNYDVILGLSTGGEPLKGLSSVDRPDNCLIWTMCGVPALNIPALRGPNGLPYGVQVIARRYSDYLLLNFISLLRSVGLAPDGTNPIPSCVPLRKS
jgi:Asp-tRNA(Asn)/Glu-tRNA(Gln) amidotransferase A subunit family amidase